MTKSGVINGLSVCFWEYRKSERLNRSITNNYLILSNINYFQELYKELDRTVLLSTWESPI